LVKLDLACGQRKIEGYLGVDKYETGCTDIVHDLLVYPWPFEDNSVDEVVCVHFLEHIPGRERPKFMDELWRVMKVGGKVIFSVPPWNSERAYQDYTHEWPPLTPSSFAYWDREWREKMGLTHGDYEMKCNFRCQLGANMAEDWKSRAYEVQQFSAKYYVNTSTDLIANLWKKE